jgi:hypothetical protein
MKLKNRENKLVHLQSKGWLMLSAHQKYETNLFLKVHEQVWILQ